LEVKIEDIVQQVYKFKYNMVEQLVSYCKCTGMGVWFLPKNETIKKNISRINITKW